jgi:hypothetical protein
LTAFERILSSHAVLSERGRKVIAESTTRPGGQLLLSCSLEQNQLAIHFYMEREKLTQAEKAAWWLNGRLESKAS